MRKNYVKCSQWRGAIKIELKKSKDYESIYKQRQAS